MSNVFNIKQPLSTDAIYQQDAAAGSLRSPPLMPSVHLASLRDPRLEEFPVGGGSNKLKFRLSKSPGTTGSEET